MRPAVPSDTEETQFGKLLDRELFLRFWGYARPYRKWVFIAIGLLPLSAIAQLGQPLLVKLAVDRHLVTGELEGFSWLLVILGGLALLQFIAGYGQTILNALLGQRVVRDMRQDLFAHLLRQDAPFYAKNESGRLTNRVTNDTEAVSQMVSQGLVNLVGDVLLLVGIMVSMVWLSPKLAGVTLIALPIIILVTMTVTRKMRKVQRQSRLLQSQMASRLTEEVEGHQVVRLFHRQEKNRTRFDGINRDHLHHTIRIKFFDAFQFSFVEAAATITIALLFFYASQPETREAITLGTLVAFIDYLRRIFLPIRDLSSKITTMQAAMTALERIFSLIDTPPTIQDRPTEREEANQAHSTSSTPQAPQMPPSSPFTSKQVQGAIRFRNVGFSYGDDPVLKGINVTVAPGERVAIAGPTGAGKSSLIQLVNRTYEPTEGTVELDGVDITHIPLATLRPLVGVVWQETFLFAGTIADNISLEDPRITPERIRWAAKQTGADTFIDVLADGYETELSERGSNLSAGQRQLLGLARVLAADPKILVMDEATSSVDTISERLIQKALERIFENRTALIIAHRLSTIEHADRILVISDGEIVESGPHQALLNQNGLYAQLHALQFDASSHSSPVKEAIQTSTPPN
ncbi:MAG: ABC transporter ATP-binding protein [Magnetococcales bacterium]|nr:ABC transporter ATP-binding protein [Magnetococcales bacterium]